MSLWVDKCRPNNLKDLTCDYKTLLMSLARCESLPHLLFHGPSGSGKRTIILAFISEVFGTNVSEKCHIVQKTYLKKVHISVMYSKHHVEVTPSDVGGQDRTVVQELFNELSDVRINTYIHHQSADKKSPTTLEQKMSFTILVINCADQLSREAQEALRRLMEVHANRVRVIFSARHADRMIEPLRSRCERIPVRAKTPNEIKQIIHQFTSLTLKNNDMTNTVIDASFGPDHVSSTVNISDNISSDPVDQIITDRRDLRLSLLVAETFQVQKQLLLPDWIVALQHVAATLLTHPGNVLAILKYGMDEVRQIMMSHVCPNLILFELAKHLVHLVKDDKLKCTIMCTAAIYEERLSKGFKPIFHINAFIAAVLVHLTK